MLVLTWNWHILSTYFLFVSVWEGHSSLWRANRWYCLCILFYCIVQYLGWKEDAKCYTWDPLSRCDTHIGIYSTQWETLLFQFLERNQTLVPCIVSSNAFWLGERRIIYKKSCIVWLKCELAFRNLVLVWIWSALTKFFLLSSQIGVTVFLALIVGAIFFGVKEDQSGIQNRWVFFCLFMSRSSFYFF